MQFSFTDKQQSLYDSICDFASGALNNNVSSDDQTSRFPSEKWNACGQTRLQGLCIPEIYGGGGFDAVDTCVALEALGFACDDGGLNFSIAAHLLACTVPVWQYGSEEQKNNFLPRMCDGSMMTCNAMTESGTGSDAYAMKSLAEKSKTGYKIIADKTFVTNAPVADLALVYAMTNREKGFYGGVSAFLLEKKYFSSGSPIKKMGLRTSPMSSLHIAGEVPLSALVGKEGSGALMFAESMNWERALLSALHVGTMKKIIALCREFIQMHAIKEQYIDFFIADMAVCMETARLLVYRAAESLLNKDRNTVLHASMAKYTASESLNEVCRLAERVLGTIATTNNHPLERYLRDAAAAKIYSGTNEIQKNIIASFITTH